LHFAFGRPGTTGRVVSFSVLMVAIAAAWPGLPPVAQASGEVWSPTPATSRRHVASRVEEMVAKKAAPAGRHLPSLDNSVIQNILVNDPTGQLPFEDGNTQMEPSVAASGDTVVCGFTDSEGFYGAGTLSGYAISFDGAASWFDAGSLQGFAALPNDLPFGDPTVVTDGRGTWFYLSTWAVGNHPSGPEAGDFGLVLHRGHFIGTNLIWSSPILIAGGGAGNIIDHPHMAVDVVNDRLYVTYTNLGTGFSWGQVEVRTYVNAGTTLVHHVVVQPQVGSLNNAGSRLAVGPNGEVYCAWESGLYGGAGQGPASQRVSRSLDLGASFAAPVTAATVIESWFSGPPGANREEQSVEYPSIAVDCSNGPNRGRVYMVWQDAVLMNFGGATTNVAETAANNETPQQAQGLPVATQYKLSGTFNVINDRNDYYSFTANAGEHVRVYVQPPTGMFPSPWQIAARLRCANPVSGADTLLAAGLRMLGNPAHVLVSIPTTGTYYLQLERYAGQGSYDAYVRRSSNVVPSAAIDHRDVVMVSSADGVSGWTVKRRVNDDTGSTDQAFPEVVVDGCGAAHVTWYDRRFDPRCRVQADVMMSASFDGGTTFAPNVRLTTESSSWQVPVDAVPNFGDYIRPYALGTRLYVPWADGRLGSPDVFVAPLQTALEVTVPDSIRAVKFQPLGLSIPIGNPTAYSARVEVQITSSCQEFPDTTCVIDPVPSGKDTVCTYSPIVGDWIHEVVPCTLVVTVTSNRSGCVVREPVVIINDAVPVTVQDFTAWFEASAVRLAWHAPGTARFEVERSTSGAEGPYELRGDAIRTARGGYEFVDEDVTAGEHYAYRLVAYDVDGTTATSGPFMVEAQIPRRLALLGAQPNPFNPSTRLRFELPAAAPVTLRILDVRGRVVTTLLESSLRAAGLHAVLWDGRDHAGKPQASGVYLTELRVQGAVRTARIVLLR